METAAAHIESAGLKYVFAGKNMFMVCLMAMGFVLFHNLLANRNLIFFVDGGRDIKSCMKDLSAFCPKIIILDWLHLKKHCIEGLGMALASGKMHKETRCKIRRELFRILWASNVEGTKDYLKSIDPQYIRNQAKISEPIKYLEKNDEYIACHAIRKRLGLQISGSRVEKANDLVVAEIQKGKCMSQSHEGSLSTASCTAAYLNNDGRHFIEDGECYMKLYPKYGQVFMPVSSQLAMAV